MSACNLAIRNHPSSEGREIGNSVEPEPSPVSSPIEPTSVGMTRLGAGLVLRRSQVEFGCKRFEQFDLLLGNRGQEVERDVHLVSADSRGAVEVA